MLSGSVAASWLATLTIAGFLVGGALWWKAQVVQSQAKLAESSGEFLPRTQKLVAKQAAGDHLPSEPRNPEDATQGAEVAVQVQRALGTLPAGMRMPLVMYELEGLSYGEIADSLSVAEGTVKSRIHRARQMLKRELAPVAEEL